MYILVWFKLLLLLFSRLRLSSVMLLSLLTHRPVLELTAVKHILNKTSRPQAFACGRVLCFCPSSGGLCFVFKMCICCVFDRAYLNQLSLVAIVLDRFIA